MNSFMLALSVVLPLVVYMTVGGLICRFSIFSKDNFKTLNGLIFKIFIPLTLFMRTAACPFLFRISSGISRRIRW